MTIDPRFNGPPGTGNGGYTAGLIASHLGVPAQVTLRLPPPLGTPLRLRTSAEGVAAYEGERLIAEAEPDRHPDPEPVPPVSYAEAEAAAAAYPGFADHPFPTCYVCGPQRPAGDGLRIFPGPVPGGSGTAAPWHVPDDVTETMVWAALDCPGGWTIIGSGRPYVLGRMAAVVHAVPPPGADCVVVGALVSTQGRKATVRTALYPRAPSGAAPLAYARATWLSL